MKNKKEITIGMYYNLVIWFNIDHPFIARIPIINKIFFELYLRKHLKYMN